MSKPTSARGRLSGLLLSVALAVGASGCILNTPDGEDGLGFAEEPLAAWEAGDRDTVPPTDQPPALRRHGGTGEPVGCLAPSTVEESDSATGDEDESNPDPTPWHGSAASAAGEDGNPDPTPWQSSDEEEGSRGSTDEGQDGEPDPQPWMHDVGYDTDDTD